MNYIDAIAKFAHLVPGCPEPEAVDALRYAVIKFAERTAVMTQWFETTSALMTFDVAEAGVQIDNVVDAFIAGKRATVAYLNSPALLSAQAAAPVIAHGADMNATLAVVPNPATAVIVRMLVVLTPTQDATAFSDSLWRLYREALISGALSRLLRAPGTAYRDTTEAANHLAEFDRAVVDVGAFAGSLRTTPARRLRVAHTDGFVAGEHGEWSNQAEPPSMHQIYWTETDHWIATNYWM